MTESRYMFIYLCVLSHDTVVVAMMCGTKPKNLSFHFSRLLFPFLSSTLVPMMLALDLKREKEMRP